MAHESGRLWNNEVAEILISQQLVDVHEFLGDVLQVLGQSVDLVADTPVHCLYLGTCLQVNDAMREQVEHLLTYLFSIVPVLQDVAGRQVIPYLIQVFHQLV